MSIFFFGKAKHNNFHYFWFLCPYKIRRRLVLSSPQESLHLYFTWITSAIPEIVNRGWPLAIMRIFAVEIVWLYYSHQIYNLSFNSFNYFNFNFEARWRNFSNEGLQLWIFYQLVIIYVFLDVACSFRFACLFFVEETAYDSGKITCCKYSLLEFFYTGSCHV